MTRQKRIFVDTSAWVEFMLKGELYHQAIFNYFDRETKNGSKFFTNDYVLDETYTRLITNQSFTSANTLKQKLKKAQSGREILVLFTDETLFNKAWSAFEKFREHKLSFTDAVIATVAKDLKIDEILTLDRDFAKVGFSVKPVLKTKRK